VSNWRCCADLTCLADLPSTPLWGEAGRQVEGWCNESVAGPAGMPSTLEGEAGWRGVQWQAGSDRSSLLWPPSRGRGWVMAAEGEEFCSRQR
jgi:hypothetical protein